MAPEDIHILIPGICEYVSLNGKRVFADMIKGTRWGDYPELPK